MIIKNIHLKNFRNYENEKINFKNTINLIFGDNAQGKTNIVEGIMLCCVGRSPRTSKDKELIRFGFDNGYVKCDSLSSYGSNNVELYITKSDNKRIKINEIPIIKMGELVGQIKAIYFSPDELKLVKDAPQDRRRFLDIDISQLKKSYFYALKKYNKILSQRNNLLKKYSEYELKKTIELYDMQLAECGALIIIERGLFCDKLSKYVSECHEQLTDNKEKIKISYSSQVDFSSFVIDDIKNNFLNGLKNNLSRDIDLRYTTIGPHRDDIKIVVNDKDIKKFGSQGQQRSAALSMKIAELEIFKEFNNEYPILILDDVLSELDDKRKINLINMCRKCQTIITSVNNDEKLFSNIDYNFINISEGKVII